MDISYYYLVIKKSTFSSKIDDALCNEIGIKEYEGIKYDAELMEIYNFSNKFSCWTDWDIRMEMMFIPIPLHIKELFINYCKEKNIQNASLMDKVEIENMSKYYEDYYESKQPVENDYLVTEVPVAG
jgi:RNase adaptor protein for sRNA GlmZ degradation